MTFREFWQPLTSLYDEGEARSIARMAMERRFGLTLADIAIGAVEDLEEEKLTELHSRLMTGEPVQYVLGEAEFCGRLFHVEPGVLIPRPETEWLCRKIASISQGLGGEASTNGAEQPVFSVLDIGTGSGCIACTVALDAMPPSAVTGRSDIGQARTEVVAWDISDRAIAVARRNAEALGARVSIEKTDALHPPADSHRWDVIVSNPPYICLGERSAMHGNVLQHEPPTALFVPDDDPLLFYRAIARYSVTALKPGGSLLLEINPLYADRLRQLLLASGFATAETMLDEFGKMRYGIAATQPAVSL